MTLRYRLLERGDVVDQKYLVEEELGQGAMGAVYRVKHLGLSSTFALKLLLPVYSVDQNYRMRFRREAQINAQLQHPNVVQVYDSGEHEGMLFSVMELLAGKDLEELLSEGAVDSMERILDVSVQLARALQAGHAIGLVHRDLKPANVLIEVKGERWRCVLVDFGLAFIQDSEDFGRLTKTKSTVAGTPLYMSPEQVSGEALTGASDMYSLGCLMFEMIEGKTPFDDVAGEVMKVLSRHLFSPPPRMRRVEAWRLPVMLESLVMQMLEKDPTRRPHAAKVVSSLQDLLSAPTQWGRGGDHRSRGDRMVQPDTARAAMDTLPLDSMFETARMPASAGVKVGCLGELEEIDLIAALASNGYGLVPYEHQHVDLLFGRDLTPERVAQLKEIAPVIAVVEPGDVDAVAEFLRAGAADVVPPSFTVSELTRRFKRAHRRSQARKKS